MKFTTKIRIYLPVIVFLSLYGYCPSTHSQPLNGRLIKLEVRDSEDVKAMMDNFLTSNGFILADDDQVPRLMVDASERMEGTRLNATVTYRINRMELNLPGTGLVYSSSVPPAKSSGRKDEASRRAIYLLREYLKQDRLLIDRLNQVTPLNYYDLELPDQVTKERLAVIETRLTELALMLEENADVRNRLLETENSLLTSNERLASLAQAINQGKGRVSEQAVSEILIYQKQLVRQKKSPYFISEDCPRAESTDYNAVGAVMIRIPASGQALKTGRYSIYADNQCVVYTGTEHYHGPRFFRSMESLRISSVGQYFRSTENYLDIKAVAYHPEDRSIIISKCDADAVMYANMRGMHPDKIFSEGRIILIPEP